MKKAGGVYYTPTYIVEYIVRQTVGKLLDGATDAGLHVKAPCPIDGVVRIDRRLQSFDLPTVESLTRDPTNKTVDKTLAVDAFVSWRVADADGADRFVRTLGTPDQVKRVLGPQISGRLGAIISTLPMDALIAVADEAAIDARTARLRDRLLLGAGDTATSLRDEVRAQYGIEIVDLRLRRFTYPEAVRSSIAERIRSERMRKVADHESEGRQRAAEILTTAEKEAKETESRARAEKTRLEGVADVEADRIRNDAHAPGPRLLRVPAKAESLPGDPERHPRRAVTLDQAPPLRVAPHPPAPRAGERAVTRVPVALESLTRFCGFGLGLGDQFFQCFVEFFAVN